MGARTNAGAPVVKRPFDLQEAVILLDVYLNSMIKTASLLPKLLREHQCAFAHWQKIKD